MHASFADFQNKMLEFNNDFKENVMKKVYLKE